MQRTKKRDIKKVKGLGLSESMWAKLDKLAARQNRSRNNYIESVLQQHVAQTDIR